MRNNVVLSFFNYFTSSVLLRLISLISVPILLSIISKNDYGMIILLQSYVGVCSVLLSLNIGSSSARYIYENFDDTNFFIFNSLKLLIFIYLFLSFILIIFYEIIRPSFKFDLFVYILLAGLLKALVSMLLNNLIAISKSRIFSVLLLFEGLGTIFIMLGFSFYFPKYIIYSSLWSIIFLDSIIVVYIIYNFFCFFSFENIPKNHLSYIARFSFPQLPNAISGLIVENVAKVIIGNSNKLALVGDFHIFTQIVSVVPQFMGAIRNTLIPKYYENIENEVYIKKGFWIYFISLFLIGFVVIIFSPLAIQFFFPQCEFDMGVILLLVYSAIFYENIILFNVFLEIDKKTGLISFITISNGVLLILLSNFLYDLYDYEGIVFALPLSYTITLVVVSFLMKKIRLHKEIIIPFFVYVNYVFLLILVIIFYLLRFDSNTVTFASAFFLLINIFYSKKYICG